MKISRRQLRRIIKEELSRFSEGSGSPQQERESAIKVVVSPDATIKKGDDVQTPVQYNNENDPDIASRIEGLLIFLRSGYKLTGARSAVLLDPGETGSYTSLDQNKEYTLEDLQSMKDER